MAFCIDKFVILSRNFREIRYFGREIRHSDRDFGREIDHFAIARYREIRAKKSR